MDKCNDCESINVFEYKDPDKNCSCHINPPCGFCTEIRMECGECGNIFDPNEELYKSKVTSTDSFFKKQKEAREARGDKLKNRDRSEFFYISSSNTHSSMIKEGMFPESMSVEELAEKLKGSFGGKFKILRKEEGYFKYIAYTD